MIARSDVDKDRVGLIGYSLGARTAMTCIAESDPGKAQVLVDFFGPVKDWGDDDPIKPPISTGTAKFPPTIIFHDEKDRVVPVAHSVELKAILPGTSDLRVYKTEPSDNINHVFKAGGAADTDSRQRATEWIKTHLPV